MKEIIKLKYLFYVAFLWMGSIALGQDDALNYERGDLIYENPFSSESDVANWIMEGPGEIEFKDAWMHMQSSVLFSLLLKE